MPDILVHMPFSPHVTALVEIKDGAAPPSQQKLTPAQEVFHAAWKGPLYVVKSVDDVAWVLSLDF